MTITDSPMSSFSSHQRSPYANVSPVRQRPPHSPVRSTHEEDEDDIREIADYLMDVGHARIGEADLVSDGDSPPPVGPRHRGTRSGKHHPFQPLPNHPTYHQFSSNIRYHHSRRRQNTKHLRPAIPFTLANQRVSSSAWVALDSSNVVPKDFPHKAKAHEQIAFLESRGFVCIDWNGKDSFEIVDDDGRVIGVLAGQPQDEATKPNHVSWGEARRGLEETMRHAQREKKPSQEENRRGAFEFVYSHGEWTEGSSYQFFFSPKNLSCPELDVKVMDDLLQKATRIARYGSQMFALYNPNVHAFYVQQMEALRDHDPTLRFNFERSAFAACTFNIGPSTVTLPHLDRLNLSWGWCTITALGAFDPDLGGHFVLWDLGLIIRFPPGATILIPSALLTHSNLQVYHDPLTGKPQERFSFTQYSAGPLFQYIDNGFSLQTPRSHIKGAARKAADALRNLEGLSRWAKGLGLFRVTKSRSSE
ncbi:hypothetical protein H0H93_009390 [Arthromyces matolae]|nr:hypothetical protein H0H93_009390 [Arthromyces matolae]